MTNSALRAWTLADVVAAEQAQVAAGSDGCGYSCHCHGDITCLRTPHPHDPDQDMGEDRPRGNVVPHVGRDPQGQLVQWVCTDSVGCYWCGQIWRVDIGTTCPGEQAGGGQ